MKKSKIDQSEFSSYFNTYISLVENQKLIKSLKKSKKHVLKIFGSLPKEKHEYQYAEGKWTAKELLLHIVDNERIFVNRALRFARNDNTNLPSYDHNLYVENSAANNRKLKDILKEYKTQRNASIQFFKSLNKEMLAKKGFAGKNEISVKAIAYILAGHDLHHCKVFKEKYL